MLSTDGSFVGFASHASTLLPGTPCPDTNAKRDIFISDMVAGTIQRRSVDSAGAQATGHSFNPDITSDGRVAVFESAATNLLGPNGDTNGKTDVFQNLSPQGSFVRGDANHDGVVDISDSTWISNWIFQGGPPPPCYDAADANDDGAIDGADIVRINQYLFQGGEPPECPFSCTATTSCCGKDPSGDGLPCGQALAGCTQFAANGSCSNCP